MNKLFPIVLALLFFGCDEDNSNPVASDTTAPIITIAYPSDNATLSNETSIWIDLLDDSEIFSIVFHIITSEGLINFSETGPVDSPYEYVLDICALSAGDISIAIQATDYSGNTGHSGYYNYTIEDADYDCTGLCGGDAVLDECGVCDNDSSNDCTQDECGVFGGDGSTCSSSIKGYVYNEAGNPVPNAYIFLGYSIENISRPSTSVQFSLPEAMAVNIWVENQCGEIVDTLIDEEYYSAGSHQITWEATNSEGLRLLDGIYEMTLMAGEESHTQNITLMSNSGEGDEYSDCTANPSGELECDYAAITNSEGYFEFSQDCLSLGVQWIGTDESGNLLGLQTFGQLKLFADDGQKYGYTDFFDVDEFSGAEVNIILNNE